MVREYESGGASQAVSLVQYCHGTCRQRGVALDEIGQWVEGSEAHSPAKAAQTLMSEAENYLVTKAVQGKV